MGACFAKKQVEQETLFTKIQKIIENNDLANLETITATSEFIDQYKDINCIGFNVKGLQLNLLGLALYFGSCECFKFIQKILGASLETMEKQLTDQKTSAIEITCVKNNSDILDFYLPYYADKADDEPILEEISLSLDLSNNPDEKEHKLILSTHTAIQKACEFGNMNIISHVYKYFLDKPTIPLQLNIDYQDESTGENCALIACRTGNHTMIRFLHSTCHCNFRLLNKQGESAVQIIAATNKRKALRDFHESFVYLINNVGVDIVHNCEETLLLLETEKSINFFEKKLKEKGVVIDKDVLEEKYKLVKVDQLQSLEEAKLDPYYGTNFDFKKLYGDVMQATDNEEISIISDSPRLNTPFASVLGDLN